MPTVNDFEAYVAVDNQQLVHYGMRHFVRDRILECWIPSVVGKVSIFHLLDGICRSTRSWLPFPSTLGLSEILSQLDM